MRVSLIKYLLPGIILLLFPFVSQAAEDMAAREWNSMSSGTQGIYLIGFREGFDSGQHDILAELMRPYAGDIEKEPPPYVGEILRYKFNENPFRTFDLDAIRGVVCDIYKDPVNIYIPISVVIDIAIDKLKGKSKKEIERRLESARKVVNLMRKGPPEK